MDEDAYRSTYNEVNTRRCVYEKALHTRRCFCALSTRFNLADREGVACESLAAHHDCQGFLDQLRGQTRFVFAQNTPDQPLGHAQALKLQHGGLLGLQQAVRGEEDAQETIEDVSALIRQALSRYADLAGFPYDEIIRSVSAFKGRQSKRPPR